MMPCRATAKTAFQSPTYEEKWNDICSGMAWISAALGLPDETDTSPQPQTPLHIADAIEIVLRKARQNMLPGHADRERQMQACNLLEDFAVNHLGDDSPPAAIAIPANHVLVNALKLTIVCCLEALTADWDKSDDGFISLIDAAQRRAHRLRNPRSIFQHTACNMSMTPASGRHG